MKFTYDDGGRAAAGYKGDTGDCVCRAIAIAAQMDYQSVYNSIGSLAAFERPRNRKRKSTARDGVYKGTYRKLLKSMGWTFHSTMGVGTGCKVHLKDGELPMGRLVVRVSKHLLACIDGEIRDTFDEQRGGTRCVYGYFTKGSS